MLKSETGIQLLKKVNPLIILSALATLFVLIFVWWLFKNAPYKISERIPGLDNRPKSVSESDEVIIGQNFDFYARLDDSITGDWPRFRGSDFDNICKDNTPLAESWDSSGPPVVWQHKLGEGYAAPVIHNGRVFLLDYDEKLKADMLRCYSLKSGNQLWRRWYNVALKRNHGMSRTVPAVTDRYLVSIGPRGHVMCMNPVNGDLLWTIDMEKQFGAKVPFWYSGQCPLIDNDIAVLAPGGTSLLVGVDCASGKLMWQTPNPDSLKMSHSSVLPALIHGRKMYIYNGVGGICGIAADGDETGKMLWMTRDWSPAVMAPSPLYMGNNEIAVASCYGAGGARIRIDRNDSGYKAVVVEKHSPREGLSTDQQTPVMTGDFIWTIMPKDAGELRNQLVCYNRTDLKKPVWTSGKENRFGLGPYIVCGNRMFLLNDDGELSVFRLRNNSATRIKSYRVINGTDAWGPFAMAGGYLLMRDSRNILCLNLGLTGK
jgi:outer membrane protein assembly factor BamB